MSRRQNIWSIKKSEKYLKESHYKKYVYIILKYVKYKSYYKIQKYVY